MSKTVSTGAQRQRFKRIILGSVLFCVGCIGYQFRLAGEQKQIAAAKPIEKELAIGVDGLEQDIRASITQRVEQSLSEQQKTIQDLQAQVKNLQQQRLSTSEQTATMKDLANFLPKNSTTYPEAPNTPHYLPPPTMADTLYPQIPSYANAEDEKNQPERLEIGGIRFTAGTPIEKGVVPPKKKTIFLPPSFMPAKLMTGIDARTSHHADSNPEPIMFRVQAPAVLPNHLKANLKGCFVVGDATGDLAKERVKVRLQTLSCLNEQGNAVINQAIEGFVTDEDGKRDMAGIVISRAGSHLARSFIAGMIGGLGDAVQSANTITNVNPLGATQTMKADGVVKSGVGGGLKTATGELQQFYLDLAKQAMPVIEVGAAKNVTVVVQLGVELEIKEF